MARNNLADLCDPVVPTRFSTLHIGPNTRVGPTNARILPADPYQFPVESPCSDFYLLPRLLSPAQWKFKFLLAATDGAYQSLYRILSDDRSAYTHYRKGTCTVGRHPTKGRLCTVDCQESQSNMAFTAIFPLLTKGVLAIIAIAVARFLQKGYVHRARVRSLKAQGIVSAVFSQSRMLQVSTWPHVPRLTDR